MTLERNDDLRPDEEGAATDDLRPMGVATGADASGDEEEVAEIRSDIEEARTEMGGTLQELGDRLDPGHLMDQAKENVRDATVGRVEETAKGISDMVMETVRRNPIPAAMAGAGLAMLWMNRSSSDGDGHRAGSRYSEYYGTTSSYGQHRATPGGSGGIGDRAGEIGQTVSDRAGEIGGNVSGAVGQVGDAVGQVGENVGSTVNQGMREAGWRLERFMDSSPLALGAIALGAGAIIGSILPETRQEREYFGEASRQLGETVREGVEKAADQAEQQMDRAEESVASGSGG